MNYIECINVDYKSTRKESFYDLQLDVKGYRDVYASFDKYVEVERLEGDNRYHAEQHGLHVGLIYDDIYTFVYPFHYMWVTQLLDQECSKGYMVRFLSQRLFTLLHSTRAFIFGDHREVADHVAFFLEIMRFFTNPRNPMILALARPDPKKNLLTLVKAFGECRPLKELANLRLIMGNLDNIDEMSSTSVSMLMSIIKMIDKYDLYGQVAYSKHHKQKEVPDIYRLAAKTKGVFINPVFIEPFGLTLIEVLDNGLLIDPHDQQSIADALLKLVADKQLWAKCRANGLRNIHLFSWTKHCKTYLSRISSSKAARLAKK
ncbi:probable sucrose-phosphate synthase 1 [Tanacetum coccineum]